MCVIYLCIQGEYADSGGAPSADRRGHQGMRGGARPKEKSSTGKSWVDIVDEDRKKQMDFLCKYVLGGGDLWIIMYIFCGGGWEIE